MKTKEHKFGYRSPTLQAQAQPGRRPIGSSECVERLTAKADKEARYAR